MHRCRLLFRLCAAAVLVSRLNVSLAAVLPGKCELSVPSTEISRSSCELCGEDAKPVVFVMNGGANEGYWAIRYLLESGRFDVRTSVRSLDSPSVRRLRTLGWQGNRCALFEASNDNGPALATAMNGSHYAYLTTIYPWKERTVTNVVKKLTEQRQAIMYALEHAASTMKHVVLQSIIKFDKVHRDEQPLNFQFKHDLEAYVTRKSESLGIPSVSILRQAAYMRVFVFAMNDKSVVSFGNPNTILNWVTEDDIGKYVFRIVERALDQQVVPAITYAVSEDMTANQLAERLHGLDPDYPDRVSFQVPIWATSPLLWYKESFVYQRKIWSLVETNHSYEPIDVDEQRALLHPLRTTSFEEWYLRNERLILDRYSQTPSAVVALVGVASLTFWFRRWRWRVLHAGLVFGILQGLLYSNAYLNRMNVYDS